MSYLICTICVQLSIYQSICIHLAIYLSVHHQSIYQSISYQSICLYTINLSINLSPTNHDDACNYLMIDSPGTVWVVGHVSSHLIVVQCTGSNALLPYHFAHMPNLSVSLHIHMCGRQTPRDFTLYRIMSYYISIYLISIS